MGWFFARQSRAQLIEELTSPAHVLRHCARGNVLWTVEQVPAGVAEGRKFIGCYLLRRDPTDNDPMWGYKPMCEDSGPYYYTCPKLYLDLADPPATDTAREWREAVLAPT